MTASAAPGCRRASSSAWAGRSSAFDGMQAQNEHSPPTSRSSTRATSKPASPSRPAATSPAGPAPITITSKVRSAMAVIVSECGPRGTSPSAQGREPGLERQAGGHRAPTCRIGAFSPQRRKSTDSAGREPSERPGAGVDSGPTRPLAGCTGARFLGRDDPRPHPRRLWLERRRRQRLPGRRLLRDDRHAAGHEHAGHHRRHEEARLPPRRGRALRRPPVRHLTTEGPQRDLRRRAGRARHPLAQAARSTTFLDIRSQVTSGGEQGLLGLAFAPDYARSGRFYVYFTDKSCQAASRRLQARVDHDRPTRPAARSSSSTTTPRATTTAA